MVVVLPGLPALDIEVPLLRSEASHFPIRSPGISGEASASTLSYGFVKGSSATPSDQAPR